MLAAGAGVAVVDDSLEVEDVVLDDELSDDVVLDDELPDDELPDEPERLSVL